MSQLAAPPRYQVFISSTYDDLREERQQSTQAVLEMGHFPAGMELFPASDQSQADLIKRVISESDYYVLILGGRYGSTDLAGVSYTEMEYDWAVKFGLPVLAFVRRSLEDIPSKWVEADGEKRASLDAFRKKVMGRHVRLFDSPAELGMQVMKSLMNESRINPKVGWLRSDQIPAGLDIKKEEELRLELKDSKREIKKLERMLRDTKKISSRIDLDALARGTDKFVVSIIFQNRDKQQELRDVELSWDEIFSTIAPSMYGYIQRRFEDGYSNLRSYQFESDLLDVIRMRFLADIGTRQIKIFPHQIDTILIQFQQLGLVEITEKHGENGEKSFRGYTLTEEGEIYLTTLKLTAR